MFELCLREINGRDAGPHRREVNRGLTAPTCDFEDVFSEDGLSEDFQFPLRRHRWPPEDVAFELRVVARLVLFAPNVPVVAVRFREGRFVDHGATREEVLLTVLATAADPRRVSPSS